MAFALIIEVNFQKALPRPGPYQFGSSRAVSPVIATVILVATSVVVAIALASYSGSLFKVYTQTPQVKIVNATFSSSAKTVTIYFSNTGSLGDTLNSVSVPVGATTLTASGSGLNPNPASLQPNSTTKIVATFVGTMPAVGLQVALTTATAAGQQFTISIPVQT